MSSIGTHKVVALVLARSDTRRAVRYLLDALDALDALSGITSDTAELHDAGIRHKASEASRRCYLAMRTISGILRELEDAGAPPLVKLVDEDMDVDSIGGADA